MSGMFVGVSGSGGIPDSSFITSKEMQLGQSKPCN